MSYLDVFKNKKVLVTGHTGFKGSWLISWLKLLGANVYGLSNGIPTEPSNYKVARMNNSINSYKVDIRNVKKISKIINEVKPNFIFHLAAQALVKKSYINQFETLSTNAIGSASLLECLTSYKNKVTVVMITSDKVYHNNEWIWGYRENDKLGGNDPYSISKTMAEYVIKSYLAASFNNNSNVKIAIGRAGNVIGGGDWANDRLVPDCIKSWTKNEIVAIRSPNSTRPWQHVLEPLSGYLKLASMLYSSTNLHGESFNFGPNEENNFSVKQLIEQMSKNWKNVKWNDQSALSSSFREAGLLKLNCEKALNELNWSPVLNFEETINMTIDWYKYFYENNNANMKLFNENQIFEYMKKIKLNK